MTNYTVNEAVGFVELALALSQPLPFDTCTNLQLNATSTSTTCELHNYVYA